MFFMIYVFLCYVMSPRNFGIAPFFVVETVGGKGVCISGYAKFGVWGMHQFADKKKGANTFCYPKGYTKPGRVRKKFCLHRYP